MTVDDAVFACPARPMRWWRRALHLGPLRHRPSFNTRHTQRIVWPEFRSTGHVHECPAALCEYCGLIIVNPVGNTWGRMTRDNDG